MNWLENSILANILWGAGPIFAAIASYYHGYRSENILFMFETGIMIQLTILLYFTSGIDFSVISPISSLHTFLAAMCSSVAYYLMILAIRQSPGNLAEISLISGTWPACTVILIYFVLKINYNWLPNEKPATPTNWFGVMLVFAGLILVNWKPAWTQKLKTLLTS